VTQPLNAAVRPAAVPYSVGEHQRSVVSITVAVTNPGPDPADCSRLTISIPSDAIPKAGALTTDPSTIGVAPGDATPWAIWTGGDGRCYAVPLPPATGIPAGASAEFVLSSVVVNTMPGRVDIAVYTDDDKVPAIASLEKDRPVGPSAQPPEIIRFDVTPAMIARNGEAELTWEVDRAQVCTLAPGPVTLPSPAGGALRLPVLETTDFLLRALGPGGSASETRTVVVAPVQIEEFRCDPAGPVRPGAPVTLHWKTRYASSCSITEGIGEVAGSGQVTVPADRTAVYTLTASGLDPQQRSVVVEVAASAPA
jgi:hypothetical protein